MEIQQITYAGTIIKKRRTDLCARMADAGLVGDNGGVVVLFASYEQSGQRFEQDSTFYYFTGIEEPGAVATIDIRTGYTTVYLPQYQVDRSRWVSQVVVCDDATAHRYAIDTFVPLGKPMPGYSAYPFFERETHEHVLSALERIYTAGGSIWSTVPGTDRGAYATARHAVLYVRACSDILARAEWKDMSLYVQMLRRSKDMWEIECLNTAIDITHDAYEKAIDGLLQGGDEAQVAGLIAYAMTSNGVVPAYPAIVAAGRRATILHYQDNTGEINASDLVLIDIGARYRYYCADITRTYPASGKFTERQRELYSLVLATQEHVAQLAKPGMWLNNPADPEHSLHHQAVAFLRKKGYAHYFIHGIGHYLGLDVHDVGDSKSPLQEGDVITIEPGIYIPEENIGIRIEDNYWIVKGGAVCLSDAIAKQPEDIEKIMAMAKMRHTDSDESLRDDEEDSFASIDIIGDESLDFPIIEN